ncbi:MAG: Gp37-like protein [Candidatus Spyradocola sp.]|jgi:hypothetical protein
MATIFVYAPFRAASETFTSNQLKATQLASDIMFVERYCEVGEFAFSVPAKDGICQYLNMGNLIAVDGEYWGIIREVQQRDGVVKVTGEDLKGLLGQRITLYPEQTEGSGLQGYDAIKDVSTETLVKYFVAGNAVTPSDPNRAIIGLELAPDQGRGEPRDAYMTRFETLPDLLRKNLELRKMGWEIKADLARSKYVFDVVQGLDRTGLQYDNPRVIFDVELRSALAIEYAHSSKSFRNLFYASLAKSRSTEQVPTCMYPRDESKPAPSGVDRREQHLNVSISVEVTDLYAQLKAYALKDAEQYRATETISVEDAGKYEFKADYNLGDTVTIQAHGGVAESLAGDAQLISVTTTWLPSGGLKRDLLLGEARITRLGALKRQMKNEGE